MRLAAKKGAKALETFLHLTEKGEFFLFESAVTH